MLRATLVFPLGLAACSMGLEYQSVFPDETWPTLAHSHVDDTKISVLVIGGPGCTSGGDCNGDHERVAASAYDLCQREGCDFGLFLGDHFVPGTANGNTNVDTVKHRRWETMFEEHYRAFGALQDFQFWGAFGEHDYSHGNRLQTQVQYSVAEDYNSDGLWLLPDRHYGIPNLPEFVQIEMVDTVVITCGWEGAAGVDQVESIASAFADSPAVWRIVAGHHPAMSIGDRTDRAIDKRPGGKVKPDLDEARDVCRMRDAANQWRQGGMNLLLSAHEHNQQILEAKGYVQVISGSASQVADDIDDDERAQAGVVDAHARAGFAIVTLTATNATVELYGDGGSQLSSATWTAEEVEALEAYRDALVCDEVAVDCEL